MKKNIIKLSLIWVLVCIILIGLLNTDAAIIINNTKPTILNIVIYSFVFLLICCAVFYVVNYVSFNDIGAVIIVVSGIFIIGVPIYNIFINKDIIEILLRGGSLGLLLLMAIIVALTNNKKPSFFVKMFSFLLQCQILLFIGQILEYTKICSHEWSAYVGMPILLLLNMFVYKDKSKNLSENKKIAVDVES